MIVFLGIAVGVLMIGLTAHQETAQAFESKISLQFLAQQFHTPQDLAHFMWRHFRFEADQSQFGREDYWQSPEELLTRQEGDCEDFALFAHEVLKRMGQASLVLNIYGDRFAHSICLFKQNGRYQIFDGASLISSKAQNLEEIASEIYPFWKKATIVGSSIESHEGRILKELNRQR